MYIICETDLQSGDSDQQSQKSDDIPIPLNSEWLKHIVVYIMVLKTGYEWINTIAIRMEYPQSPLKEVRIVFIL